jgi:ATP-dependent helicase/nuclease subunit A
VPAERPLLDRARRLFERFTPLRDRLPAHELLRRLLFESGYGAAVALLRDGPQRVANLRKLLRVAGAAPDLSLGEFLREIEEARDREDKVALERLYGDGGDVVTITSVHGAKGLEWPVVIWADLVREMTGEKEKLVIGRDSFSLQAGLEPGEDAKAKDARHEDAKRHADLEGRAESYRTWYVAATRAKELLILSGLPAGDDTRKTPSPARIFRGSLGDPGQLKEFAYESRQGVIYAAPVRAIAGPGGLGAERAESAPDLTLPPARRRAPSGAARLSASQLMTFAHEAEQWRRLYVARFDGAGANGLSRTATRAVVTGQIVHDVLERIANAELEFEALLEDAIGRWDEDAPDAGSDAGRAYRAFVRERIAAATASPAWQALAAAPGARRELAFTRVLADGTVINGAFDLAAPLDGGVRLLDVKTGAVGSGDELAERYRVQAAVYCDAARAITGAASCDFALLSLPGGSVIEVALDVDVAALIARLRAFDGGE